MSPSDFRLEVVPSPTRRRRNHASGVFTQQPKKETEKDERDYFYTPIDVHEAASTDSQGPALGFMPMPQLTAAPLSAAGAQRLATTSAAIGSRPCWSEGFEPPPRQKEVRLCSELAGKVALPTFLVAFLAIIFVWQFETDGDIMDLTSELFDLAQNASVPILLLAFSGMLLFLYGSFRLAKSFSGVRAV